jgi:hypothetical protein
LRLGLLGQIEEALGLLTTLLDPRLQPPVLLAQSLGKREVRVDRGHGANVRARTGGTSGHSELSRRFELRTR